MGLRQPPQRVHKTAAGPEDKQADPFPVTMNELDAIGEALGQPPSEIILPVSMEETDTIGVPLDGPPTAIPEKTPEAEGLFQFRKWWEYEKVELRVNGSLLEGVPIFADETVMRIVNDDHSYFIPLCKVDYIRTENGFNGTLSLSSSNI